MEQVEIYKKLKALRKERGLTLNNLADKIGSDYQQLSRIERGKSKLSIEMLMKMADALDTPVTDIVRLNEVEKKSNSTSAKSSTSPDLLSLILEKIELMIDEVNRPLKPSLKAQLSSKIFQKAEELRSSGQEEEMHKFIEFSINLIKTILKE